MSDRKPSPATRAICGPYMDAVQAMADALGTSRATVLRSMIRDWFEAHPTAADHFGAPVEVGARSRPTR